LTMAPCASGAITTAARAAPINRYIPLLLS
jgi:hypothetical protein